MRKSYYLINDNRQEGPYAFYELKDKKISDTTLIWCDGLEGWKQALDVPEVNELLKGKSAPPPLIPNQLPKIPRTPSPIAVTPQSNTDELKFFSKKTIYVVAALCVLILGYRWHMDSVVYPEAYGHGVADKQAEQLRIAEAERLKNEEVERKAEERRKFIRNNFSQFIYASNSSYTYYEIGGIENLTVTLHNTSEYRLDKAVVTIEYIKSNGELFKSEEVVFDKVKAKSENTLKAPNSGRGTKVHCYVSYIYSERLNMKYPQNMGTENRQMEDPFKLDK